MVYTKEVYEKLMQSNSFLQKCEKDKYNVFKDIDPFSDIANALLNSEDILKYVVTTGMIEPFYIEKLAGATYSCEFSGEYFYWDSDKVQKHRLLGEHEELILDSNSITYLAVKEYFRIPAYIALRFNLRVPHAYKGLLLGTGPIVDPRFVGQLFIPLHNLTSNKYVIKKGAQLIHIEFTKMSKNDSWKPTPRSQEIVNELNFDMIKYAPTQIKEGRKFFEYITAALTEDPLFCKSNNEEIYINSCFPEEINGFRNEINNYNIKLDNKCDELDKRVYENEFRIEQDQKISQERYKGMKSAENFVKAFISIALISVFVAVGALIYTAINFSNSTNEVLNSTKQQLQIATDQNKSYGDTIKELKDRIYKLENPVKP